MVFFKSGATMINMISTCFFTSRVTVAYCQLDGWIMWVCLQRAVSHGQIAPCATTYYHIISYHIPTISPYLMFKSCLIPLFDWLNHHVGCLNILNHPPFPARHSRPVCQVEGPQGEVGFPSRGHHLRLPADARGFWGACLREGRFVRGMAGKITVQKGTCQDLKCAVQWIKDSITKMENSERPSTFPRVNSLSHLAC